MYKRYLSVLLSCAIALAPVLPAHAAAVKKKTAETQFIITPVTIQNAATGVLIEWKRSDQVGGYYVFRRKPGGSWKKAASISGKKHIRWTDTSASNGVLYEYMVVGYKRKKIAPVTIKETIPVSVPEESEAPNPTETENPESTPPSGSTETAESGETAESTGGAGEAAGSDTGNTSGNTDASGADGTDGSGEGSGGTGSDEGSGDTGSGDTSGGSGAGEDSPSTKDPQSSKDSTDGNDTSGETINENLITVSRTEYPLPADSSFNYKTLTAPLVSGKKLTACRLSAPVIKKVTKTSSTSRRVTWKKNAKADGYLLQYAPNRTFTGAKTKTIRSASVLSADIRGLSKKKTWYFRICAVKYSGKVTYRSLWSSCKSSRAAAAITVKKEKKGSKTLELRSASGQSMKGYDTVQGACSDGVYSYHVLYNRIKNNCIIVKMKPATKKIVKKSRVLSIHHGNDLAYNADTRHLVVVHGSNTPMRLTEIDPGTLTVTSDHDITLPATLYGASKKTLAAIKGFTAITYDAAEHRYAVRIKESRNFLILDSSMTPVRYVKNTCPYSFSNQGIACSGDYLIFAQSASTAKASATVLKQNALVILDWDGNYITKIRINGVSELESTYFIGTTLYGNTYQSGNRYVTVKRKVPVKKKKKVKGKYKTVKMSKTVKVRVKQLYRDNHIFLLNSF